MRHDELTRSFSPAFGGRRKEATTTSIVIRHGRMMEALGREISIGRKGLYLYLYEGEFL